MKMRAEHARRVIEETLNRNSSVGNAEAQWLAAEITSALAMRCAFKMSDTRKALEENA